MKRFVLAVSVFAWAACAQPSIDNSILQARIDSLQKKVDNAYAPGLGEFMSGIQVHHAKIWFAGKSGNWKLAGFETGEIKETLDDIRKYCIDRPEVAQLPMIDAPLDSLNAAIAQGNPVAFKSAFLLLTNTCNNCHRATKHEFNVIQVPETPPFTNQLYSPVPSTHQKP